MGNSSSGPKKCGPKELTLDDITIKYTLTEIIVFCEGAVYTHLYERGQLDNIPFDSKGVILAPFSVTIPISLDLSGYPPKDMFMKDVREKLPKLLEERNGWNCSIVDNNALLVIPNIYFRKPWTNKKL
jgi:hypothetical protein